MRVLLAADQDGLRSALRLVLEQEGNMELVGEVTDLSQVLEKTGASLPDLLLLDWELSELKNGEAGRRLLATLHTLHPHLHIFVLSGRPEKRRGALAAGANHFISKTEPPEHLLSALRAVLTSVTDDPLRFRPAATERGAPSPSDTP